MIDRISSTPLLKKIFDHRDSNSLAFRFRQRRIALLKKLLTGLPKPVQILDVGGLEGFWERAGFAGDSDYRITILNLEPCVPSSGNIRFVQGNAADMSQFADGQFDVVFSNSVIEHVGNLDIQIQAGREIRRVGKRYFVQTPYRYFPVEPHFFFPFFQFFPLSVKAFLIRHFHLGWYSKTPDKAESLRIAGSVRLLSQKEMKLIFPGVKLVPERFLFLIKSVIGLGGFGP